jgi:hypothetical protein
MRHLTEPATAGWHLRMPVFYRFSGIWQFGRVSADYGRIDNELKCAVPVNPHP